MITHRIRKMVAYTLIYLDMDMDVNVDISLFQDKMASKTCTENGTWWIHPDSNRFQTFSFSYALKFLCFNKLGQKFSLFFSKQKVLG